MTHRRVFGQLEILIHFGVLFNILQFPLLPIPQPHQPVIELKQRFKLDCLFILLISGFRFVLYYCFQVRLIFLIYFLKLAVYQFWCRLTLLLEQCQGPMDFVVLWLLILPFFLVQIFLILALILQMIPFNIFDLFLFHIFLLHILILLFLFILLPTLILFILQKVHIFLPLKSFCWGLQ